MEYKSIIHNLEQFSDGNRCKRLLGVWFYLEREFVTNQCNVMVFRTDTLIFGELVYCIVSIHINIEKVTIRFGTLNQIESIIRTYRIEKEFEL